MILRSHFSLCFLLACGSFSSSFAAENLTPVYVQRAEKIAGSLALNDATKAARVRDLVAQQYQDLSVIHAKRDAAIKAAKEKFSADKSAADAAIAAAKSVATAEQSDLHFAFLAKLSVELTPEQVDGVKNGMTYGVLPNTFAVYRKMLPDLTEEQRKQILAWLTEAREHAMDASTSDEKHGWFGKYKGKINNYLAKAGINMKEAEKNLKK